jgi:hypothetical protein
MIEKDYCEFNKNSHTKDGINYICKLCVSIYNKKYHDHNTGNVHGLLCSSCNTAIGLLYDNLSIAESVVAYLKDHFIITVKDFSNAK